MRPPRRSPTFAAVVVALLGSLVPGNSARAAAPEKAPSNPHGAYVEECSLCHRAESWTPARISPKFNHAKFGFPLDAAHAQTACSACHTSLDFSKAKPKSACVDCHQDVHQGELGPDCARCHTARSFVDRGRMVRAHNLTRFPLSGAHLAADCEDCHKPAAQGHLSYVNLRSDCVACHQNDYNATTSPNHATSGISTDCTQCHTTAAWVPGKMPNHDALFFRIYSGRHRGRWTDCSDCHINPGNYVQFECILCHAHSNQAGLANTHAGNPSYTYSSQACYSCHPRV